MEETWKIVKNVSLANLILMTVQTPKHNAIPVLLALILQVPAQLIAFHVQEVINAQWEVQLIILMA